jgi:hypothetical protein
MSCPVCTGEKISQDCSVIDERGRRVIIKGKVNAVIDSECFTKAIYSPFADYLTVALYPNPWRKGDKVKYLKFKTQQELDRWSFERDQNVIVHGCLHIADGKHLIFDVNSVERAGS